MNLYAIFQTYKGVVVRMTKPSHEILEIAHEAWEYPKLISHWDNEMKAVDGRICTVVTYDTELRGVREDFTVYL